MIHSVHSRRAFFRHMMLAGAALSLGRISSFAGRSHKLPDVPAPQFDYQFRSVSVEHVKEMRSWFETLKKERKLSDNEVFRSYIDGFVFDSRACMLGAKSLIIISVPEKIQSIIFHYQGKRYDILIPCGYTDTGLTGSGLQKRIKDDIIRDHGKTVKGRIRLPLKTLAVRSGLAEYGRNNITYVDGYGSFHALYGLYTDKELDDNWGPMKMLRLCKGCSICTRECPTKCIRESDFVIDAGRCVPLYNELPGSMPEWIDPRAYNSLVGCLACQFNCPGNADGIKQIVRMAEIGEDETEFILNQGEDKAVHRRIIEKLKPFPSASDIAYFSRNLKLVLANAKPM